MPSTIVESSSVYYLFTAPTAEPQLLMASIVTARTVTIVWNPPPLDETNGIIRSYTIHYHYDCSVSEQPIEESVQGNVTSFKAVGLIPYTNYTFEVLAVTINPGPPASIVVETKQDGNYIVVN